MLLKLEPEHEAAVIEMGMSHRGEIAALAKIAQPEIGVVTNVAPVHLEYFKSVAEIARAKYELIESLPASGTAILNADDEYVSQFGRDFQGKVILYGFGRRPTFERRISSNAAPRVPPSMSQRTAAGSGRTLPLVGTHNIYNALAAIAVGLERGLSLSEVRGLAGDVAPADKARAVVQVGNITIINDCYNSNPTALDAMVDTLAAMPAKRGSWLRVRCWNWDRRGKRCIESAGHMAKRKLTCCSGCEGWRAHGRGRQIRPEFGPNSWPRLRSRGMAGTRNPRGRRCITESFARSKAGTSVGKVEGRLIVLRSSAKCRDGFSRFDD